MAHPTRLIRLINRSFICLCTLQFLRIFFVVRSLRFFSGHGSTFWIITRPYTTKSHKSNDNWNCYCNFDSSWRILLHTTIKSMMINEWTNERAKKKTTTQNEFMTIEEIKSKLNQIKSIIRKLQEFKPMMDCIECVNRRAKRVRAKRERMNCVQQSWSHSLSLSRRVFRMAENVQLLVISMHLQVVANYVILIAWKLFNWIVAIYKSSSKASACGFFFSSRFARCFAFFLSSLFLCSTIVHMGSSWLSTSIDALRLLLLSFSGGVAFFSSSSALSWTCVPLSCVIFNWKQLNRTLGHDIHTT